MRVVRKLAGLSATLLALLCAAEQAHADPTATPITTGDSVTLQYSTGPDITYAYQYGNMQFSFSNCAGCGSLELLALASDRGGTEIEIANNPTTSAIFTGDSGTADQTLSFTVTATPLTDSLGISGITNTIDGSAQNEDNNARVSSVLSSVGANNVSGSQSSDLNTPLSATTFDTVTSTTSPLNYLSFTDTLSVNASTASAGDRLALNGVTLLFQPAPEPATLALLATAVMAVAVTRRRWSSRRIRP
ncbi:MAG TPA: PEP-CTERM sorting domain-containing protein [Rhodopila sp.]